MFAAALTRTITVALIGNPNTGKSTLFGGLVGVHQHVGNYPGVTVEKKTGQMHFAGRHFEVIDLPGLYSMAPRSRDEMVAVDLLLGRNQDLPRVDVVLCVIDAGNLERNLYLVSQVLDWGLPTVVALNMVDVAQKHGIQVDLAKFEQRLGIPVAVVQANSRIGLSNLKRLLAAAVEKGETTAGNREGAGISERTTGVHTPMPAAFDVEVAMLESELAIWAREQNVTPFPRCLVQRLLLDVNGYLQRTLLGDSEDAWTARLETARARLAAAGHPVPAVETAARYDWARRLLDGVLTEPRRYEITTTDRIDHVLTHRFWGMLVFGVVMLGVFQAVFVGAKPAMEGIQAVMESLSGWLEAEMAEGALRSLLVDGVFGGVGSILAFLPQILILFGFLAILEDCGYMARSAYLMDRVMLRVGLSGKSFIPLLSSFACAVPGIMATRVIEDRRDRLTTILVAPLLTCSARLPVYALMISAFIPNETYCSGLLGLQGITLAGLYLLGILAAVVFALLFKRTLFRGKTPPFVMELPSYKWPSPRTVFYRMVERGWLFVRCAGTLILAVSILAWAALYYPHTPGISHPVQQQNSYLGRAGRVIEPIVRPLGWDWRIGCAVLASLPAREIVVATLGVMYHVDDETAAPAEEDSNRWNENLRRATWDGENRPVFNIPVALSIMVFFALCAQCAGTLAVIRRETNSWRWPVFTFAYMTVLAYFSAMATYQFGMWIGG